MIDCQIKVKTYGTQYISATKQLGFFVGKIHQPELLETLTLVDWYSKKAKYLNISLSCNR